MTNNSLKIMKENMTSKNIHLFNQQLYVIKKDLLLISTYPLQKILFAEKSAIDANIDLLV